MQSSTPSAPQSYLPIPAANGLAIVKEGLRGFFLPDPDSEDLVLRQPPLPFEFDEDELEELTDQGRPPAFTAFGPDAQDKASNQDFALSALISDPSGGKWSFAAVADGVSGKTFWPERASRIACIVAYQVFREHIKDEKFDSRKPPEKLRSILAKRLREQLSEDQKVIRGTGNMFPSTFVPSEYRKHIEDPALWYNTTLLCAAVGPRAVALWAGDGGVHLIRQLKDGEKKQRALLTTSKATAIDDFVSLNVSPGDFKGTSIGLDTSTAGLLFLSSDGFDRTLQELSMSYRDFAPPEGVRSNDLHVWLRKQHRKLSSGEDPKIERDNSSLACLSWPLPVADPNQRGLPQPKSLTWVSEPKDETQIQPSDRETLSEDHPSPAVCQPEDSSSESEPLRGKSAPDQSPDKDRPAGRAENEATVPAPLQTNQNTGSSWPKLVCVIFLIFCGFLGCISGRCTCRESRDRPELLSTKESDKPLSVSCLTSSHGLGESSELLEDLDSSVTCYGLRYQTNKESTYGHGTRDNGCQLASSGGVDV